MEDAYASSETHMRDRPNCWVAGAEHKSVIPIYHFTCIVQALFLHKITAGEIENHPFLLNCILFKFILDHQVIGGSLRPASAGKSRGGTS